MTGISGPLGKFGNLAGNLRRLAEIPSQSARVAARALAGAIDQQFDEGVDPYGNPWEPLKESTIKRGRHAPPLTDTRAMRDSVVVEPMSGAGIKVTIDSPAEFHQEGTEDMVARKILPEGNQFPPSWEAAISTAIDLEVSDNDPEK